MISLLVRQAGASLAALLLSGAVPLDRWVHVGGRPDSYEEYLDTDSVQRSGDKIIVWTRRDLVGNQGTVWHELEFDCSKRTAAVLAYVRDDGGAIAHNSVRPHRPAATIIPRSVEDSIFEIACR